MRSKKIYYFLQRIIKTFRLHNDQWIKMHRCYWFPFGFASKKDMHNIWLYRIFLSQWCLTSIIYQYICLIPNITAQYIAKLLYKTAVCLIITSSVVENAAWINNFYMALTSWNNNISVLNKQPRVNYSKDYITARNIM